MKFIYIVVEPGNVITAEVFHNALDAMKRASQIALERAGDKKNIVLHPPKHSGTLYQIGWRVPGYGDRSGSVYILQRLAIPEK